MAITTLSGAINGIMPYQGFSKGVSGTLVAGRPVSYWSISGNPTAGAFNGTLNGVTLSSTSAQVTGQMYHQDPLSGDAYLARLSAVATQPGLLMLCDRLWHNGGYTMTATTAQTIVSPTWPARDATGATTGVGVKLAVEIATAAMTTNTPTITIGYTNTVGGTNTATNVISPTVVSPPVGTFYEIGLAAGDLGVTSVQSLTLSASWVAGTMALVAYRVLAVLDLPGVEIPNAIDAFTAGFPQLYNGVVPFFVFVPSAATSTNIIGSYIETQG